jgi:hypothetical protein
VGDPKKTNLQDPLEVLELLKDAILRKDVDKSEVADALKQVLKNYEQQNRVFLIAAANAELPRVVRLMSFLHTCEGELFDSERVEDASTKELIRMYALGQSHLLSSLDNLKKVADMRLDALRAAGGAQGAEKLFSGEKDAELNALAGLPTLDAQSRDRVRRLVTGLVDAMEKDDSVSVDEDDDDESADTDSDDQG